MKFRPLHDRVVVKRIEAEVGFADRYLSLSRHRLRQRSLTAPLAPFT